MPDTITIQSLTSADRDTLLALDQSAFAFDTRNLDPERDTAAIEWDRAYGAHRDGVLAGIYVVFSFGLSVPATPPEVATVIPMAGLSWVAVHPDHRRRGLLNAMISHHLTTVHETEREPISCLFASEPSIYGRYGYGLSTESRRIILPAKTPLRVPLHADADGVTTRFEPASPDKHDAIVKRVYDAVCRNRPGHTVRPLAHWQRFLDDPESRRPGDAEALKIIVAERAGEPTGYAVLRRSPEWGERGPEGKVQVGDLQAIDAASASALWRRVLDFDLMGEVTTPWLPLDHPLALWAGEGTPGGRTGPSLWTRIVDVDGALKARGYAGDLDVVLGVTDTLCPWNTGTWRLSVGPGGSSCERTTAPADLGLDIRELGSVYLGGTTFAALHVAGLVAERRRGAVAAASTAFRSPLMPATPYMF